jgi:hypothetical protein
VSFAIGFGLRHTRPNGWSSRIAVMWLSRQIITRFRIESQVTRLGDAPMKFIGASLPFSGWH